MGVQNRGSLPASSHELAEFGQLGGGGSSTAGNAVEHLRLPAVGEYTVQGAAATQSVTASNGDMRLGPIWLPAGTYDAVAVRVDTAGSTGSTIKFVGYWDSTTTPGRPGTLAFDTAAVAATSSGVVTVTGLSIVAPAGGALLWAAPVAQGAPTTNPGIWDVSRAADQMLYTSGYVSLMYTNVATCWIASGVTGAAPTTPALTFGDQYHRLAFRRSA